MIEEHLKKLKDHISASAQGASDFLAYAEVIKKDIVTLESQVKEKVSQLADLDKQYNELESLLVDAKQTITEGQKIKEGYTELEKAKALFEKEKEALSLKAKNLEYREQELNDKTKKIQQILGE